MLRLRDGNGCVRTGLVVRACERPVCISLPCKGYSSSTTVSNALVPAICKSVFLSRFHVYSLHISVMLSSGSCTPVGCLPDGDVQLVARGSDAVLLVGALYRHKRVHHSFGLRVPHPRAESARSEGVPSRKRASYLTGVPGGT